MKMVVLKEVYNKIIKYRIKCLLYLFVTSAGFEPATNRAEICHSIQLNYEEITIIYVKILIF